MNIVELRKELVETTSFVVEQMVEQAKDTKFENRTQARQAQAKIWDAVIPMMQQLGDARKLEANNAKDVLKLLGAGKITIIEAERLMSMFHTQMEIEEVPKLTALLEQADDN